MHGLERALNPQVMNADDAEWVLVIRLLPALLLAAAPCLARLGAVRPALSRRSAGFVAPLVALGTTQALLIAQLSDEGLNARSWGTAMGTVIIAGLIILRQDGLLVENARLVGRLDRTVDTVGRRERWFRSLVEHASRHHAGARPPRRDHVRDARPCDRCSGRTRLPRSGSRRPGCSGLSMRERLDALLAPVLGGRGW